MKKTHKYKVNIYIETDTAGVRKQYRGYGVMLECTKADGDLHNSDDYGLEEATANQIMLIALIDAFRHMKRPSDITVYIEHPNQYVTENICNGRIYEWLANGWKNAKNEPIANAEEWRELTGLLAEHQITFVCKKEHSYKKLMQSRIKKIKDQGVAWKQQRLDGGIQNNE